MARRELVDKEVAHLLPVSIHTLRAARAGRSLNVPRHVKHPNGRIGYVVEDVQAWAEQCGYQPFRPFDRE